MPTKSLVEMTTTTKNQKLEADDMTIEDVERMVEFQEIELRRFKTDIYYKLNTIEGMLKDLKFVLKVIHSKKAVVPSNLPLLGTLKIDTKN